MQKFFKYTMQALVVISFMNGVSKAQMGGIYNIPSVTYPSINSFVTALNAVGVSAPVTVNVAAGYVENAPVGGIHMTASGSAANPIIFQKSGVGINPRINSYTGGTGTPNSNTQDGIWRLCGSDYITIDAIDLNDVNTTNPATMEYGFAIYKNSNISGATNNTIRNCVITLNNLNNATGSIPSADGSKGILVSFAYYNSSTTFVNPFGTLTGNSYNRFYSNIIQNCNIGIALMGSSNQAHYDVGNDVGGSSAATSNTIINYGGAPGAANSAMAIKTIYQQDLNISYNIINSNNGIGVNHPNALYGIFLGSSVNANSTVNNNTITVHGGGTTQGLYPIENNSGEFGTTNTVNICNNLITNCTYQTVTSAFYFCISNVASCFNVNINNNSFVGNNSNSNTISTCLIRNTAAVSNSVNINNNNLSFSFIGATHTGGFSGIAYQDYAATSIVRINNNNFSNVTYNNGTGTGDVSFINASGNASELYINGNTWNNLSLNNSGAHRLIYDVINTQNLLSICNNNIVTGYTRSSFNGNLIWCCLAQGGSASSCLQTISNNNFSNIQSPGATGQGFIGIINIEGATSPYPRKIISDNIISNITFGGTGSVYGISANRLGDGNTVLGSKIFNNEISSITAPNVIVGMEISSLGSPTLFADVYSNRILNLTSTNSFLYGAFIANAGAGLNFFKNKISDISSNASSGQPVRGLHIVGSNIINVYDNVIGNMTSPIGNSDNRVIGIEINSGTNVNLIHNSVYLNASSTGGTFGSSALYVVTSVNVNLQNNILVNISTPNGGAGRTVAYRRNNATIGTYSNTSGNNIFYSGTPGTNRLIGYDYSTSWQTLAAWQAAVAPRDAVSFTENTPFISTTGTAANFLNINPLLMTFAESNGTPVAWVNDDYIGSPRNVTTPDIGAWEDNFMMSTLPLELTDFKANCENSFGVSVSWKTESDFSPDFYTLEKSSDIQDWKEIANIKCSKIKNSPNEYSYTDKNPFPKVTYYRVRLITTDLKVIYSEIISAESCKDSNGEIVLAPNPATDKLYITGINNDDGIEIFNPLGQKVGSYRLSNEGHIDISALPAGTYFVRISTRQTSITRKIIVPD